MTALTIVQGVSAVVGADIPVTVFGSTERHEIEMQHLLNDAAQKVKDEKDWSALTRQFTVSGDGVTTRHPLPADFDRLLIATDILTTSTGWVMRRIGGAQAIAAAEYNHPPVMAAWGLEGRQFVTLPALPINETVAGIYQSANIVTTPGGTPRASFSDDDEEFALEDRILRLAMVWMWKANKGLPYGQDFDNYESALSSAISHDSDRTAIPLTRNRIFRGVRPAFPGVINP